VVSQPISFRTASRIPPEFGDIVISEVFWGGEEQYIELYNLLDRPVDLEQWSIIDSQIRFRLSGVLEPGSYYLLSGSERNEDLGEIAGEIVDLLDLDSSGDFIILQDSDGVVISTANLPGGAWPAGREGASMEG
jgi:hypothetical protein